MFVFDILVFLLVLGVLVFVHELGHFLAAKACGIYCDRFSLGMPPRVWGFKWGETDYCIGALPIGGYVKMAGQEDAPRTDEEREKEYGHLPPDRFYNNKPVWQRTIVIAAGPFMNLVLGVFLYGLVAFWGAEVPESKVDNRIGAVEPGSPAAEAPLYRIPEGEYATTVRTDGEPDARGWTTGDRLLSIDGRKVASVIQDARIDAVLGGGTTMVAEIERTTADGEKVRYASPIQPKRIGDDEHPSFGVAPYTTAEVGRVLRDMPAEAAGLQPGDVIVKADGRPVDAGTLTQLIEARAADEGSQDPVVLEVLRPRSNGEAETIELSIEPKTVGRIPGVLFNPPLYVAKEDQRDERPRVVAVLDRSDSDVGLKAKDIILEIDGRPATVARLEEVEKNSPGKTISLKIERPAIMYGLLRRGEVMTVDLPVNAVGAIGVQWEPRMVYHRVPASEVPAEALRLGWLALARTVQTVKMLVTGSDYVKATDLGGPVMIYQIMSDARRLGVNWLIEITAFISINLCVFNLLPLPVLDGGQLVFLGLEAIRRKPIDMRVLERVQQMGLVFIVLLILFITFNDIQRLFTSMIP